MVPNRAKHHIFSLKYFNLYSNNLFHIAGCLKPIAKCINKSTNASSAKSGSLSLSKIAGTDLGCVAVKTV